MKSNTSLLRFATNAPDEFVENISGIAPGLSCEAQGPRGMEINICAAQLPSIGMFHSTLQNFRVHSPLRSFYAVTIPLGGSSRFNVDGQLESINSNRAHLQLPGREFDAIIGEEIFESLQLCFDQVTLDSIANKVHGQDNPAMAFQETLDLNHPAAQSFTRHALFMWNELLRGGPILTSPLIAQESSNMLGTLLVLAAGADATGSKEIHRRCSTIAVQRAEDYLLENLLNPIAIADVASAARISARTLSREFRRRHGMTVKEFIKERRLEAVNRALLTAVPGTTNVTQAALEHGFDQLGRFSTDYKKAFGELPSATLAR